MYLAFFRFPIRRLKPRTTYWHTSVSSTSPEERSEQSIAYVASYRTPGPLCQCNLLRQILVNLPKSTSGVYEGMGFWGLPRLSMLQQPDEGHLG